MRAIDRADIALLVIDSTIGLTDQDQRIARFAEERGCGMIILLNKWDAMETQEDKDELLVRISDRLNFVGYAPVLRISALTGRSVDKIWDLVDGVYENYTRHISTSALNKLLTEMREFGHTVNKGGKTLRVKYVTQTRTAPPGFTFFANHPTLADDNFKRYVENRMRERVRLPGHPDLPAVPGEGLVTGGLQVNQAETLLRFVAVAVGAYLIGGIPWALVVGKWLYGVDVRTVGSGNLGATNVYRALGRNAGLATFALDALKGAAAVGLALVLVPAERLRRRTVGDLEPHDVGRDRRGAGGHPRPLVLAVHRVQGRQGRSHGRRALCACSRRSSSR